MPYGSIKVDNIIFTNGGVDQTITVSGIVASTSGNLTVTGTISGNIIRGGTTVSGATVTGAVGQFGNLTAVSGTFTTISGGTQTVTSGVFASGTAANPSISFVGDVDTGIYSSAANEVAISTNGSGRLFVDASGNVGVGTAPSARFHVSQVGNTEISIGGTSTPILSLIGGAVTDPVFGYANGALRFGTVTGYAAAGFTERMRLDSSGRLGLGTSSPGSLLHLAQSAADAVARIDGGSSNTSFIDFRIAGSNRAYVGLGGLTGGSNNDLINYNSSAGNWIAYTNGSERMRLDSSGRLGLATSTPSGQFSVAGAANLEVGFNAGTIASPVRGNLFYTTDGSGWQFRIGKLQSGTYTPQMTFTDAGNVGIGTTSPGDQGGQKLTVSGGSIAISNATANGANGELRFIGRPDGANYNWAGIRAISDININQGTLVFLTSASNTSAESSTERMRIDSSGRLLVGTSSWSVGATAAFVGNSGGSTGNADVHLSRGLAATGLSSGQDISVISFSDNAGGKFAQIGAQVDGTPGTNDYPGRLVFSTTADGASTPTERMRITSTGNVGIGNTSPGYRLDITSADTTAGVGYAVRLRANATAGAAALQFTDSGATSQYGYIACDSSSNLKFATGTTQRACIDSSGRLLVGTSSTSIGCRQVLEGSSGGLQAGIQILAASTSNPADNSALGAIYFADNGHAPHADIFARRDGGTWSASSKPTRLTFSTTADGASSPTERMRVTNQGRVLIGTTEYNSTIVGFGVNSDGFFYGTKSNGEVQAVNRLTSDGILIRIEQDSTVEGSISVSGTTVSYNGAHLSRWSQLPGGTERTEILRGTVLSNIDEMCGWGEEANEQLNRMKVSDVEGDPNVAGVFQCWDDDDDTYTDDFYCAMTGDFIIRIAEGTPVHRGQLLMSAGDGTAKPQGDGFVQDKTIAKVTSNHVTCTYDDGSYCVPCVLMAC